MRLSVLSSCITCEPSALGQKRSLGPLEVEFETLLSHHNSLIVYIL